MSEQTETMLKNICEGMAMDGQAPHALTREQCSLCTANRPRLCDQHYKQGADELLKHVTAAIQDQQTPGGVKATYEQLLELCNQQRQALTQQAQEVERVIKVKDFHAGVIGRINTALDGSNVPNFDSDDPLILLLPDERVVVLVQQLAASQARVRDLEAQYAHELEEVNRQKRLDLASECDRLRNIIRGLQATLAERERDIAKLKAELNETFVDEKETVWTRPTAWAYAMVCKARDKHEQEAGRLRNNVELMARDMCSMPSDLYQEWLDSDSQVHFRQWLAERALKGEGCQGDTPPG